VARFLVVFAAYVFPDCVCNKNVRHGSNTDPHGSDNARRELCWRHGNRRPVFERRVFIHRRSSRSESVQIRDHPWQDFWWFLRRTSFRIARVTKTFATDQTRVLTDRTMRAESSVGGTEIGGRSSSTECSSTGGVRGPNPCRSVTIRGKISGGFCGVRLSGLRVQQKRSPRIKHGSSRIGQCAPRALLEARKSATGLRAQSVHPPEEFEVRIRADP
jgi:hypothetical protein